MQNSDTLIKFESVFRLMADNAPALIWMAGEDGGYIFLNRPWLDFTGRKLEDELGMGWTETIHPEDVAQTIKNYLLAFNDRQKFQHEYRVRRNDGEYRWVINNGVPHFKSDGNFAGYIGSCIDITERKEIENKQRDQHQSKARQQAVIAELGLIAIGETDLADLMQKTVTRVVETLQLDYGSATEYQPEYRGVLMRAGYGWDEGIIGHTRIPFEPGNWVDSIFETDKPIVINDWATEERYQCPALLAEHQVRSSVSFRLEGLQRRPYGTLSGHSLTRQSFSEDDIYFFRAAANVLSAAIQRNQTQKALQRSEERFRLFQELTFDDFVVLPAIRDTGDQIIDFTWEYLNPISEKRLGKTIVDLKGKRVLEVYPTTKSSGLFDIYVNVVETGFPHQMETHYKGEGIDNWFRNIVVKVGDGVAVTSADITRIKQAEEELTRALARERSSREEMERAQEQLAFLAEASKVLNSSLEYTSTLQNLAQLVVPNLADWCTVHILDEQKIPRQLGLAHANPAKIEWALNFQKEMEERYPYDPDAPGGIPNVIRTGKAEIYPEIPDEMLVAGANGDEYLLGRMREIGYSSLLIVPLVVRGRVLGAMQLVWTESGRHYDTKDLAFAKDVAQRAAIAVENARLYHEAQKAIASQKEVDYLKDLFVSVAGHELRTPLTSIRGYAQILERSLTLLGDGEPNPENFIKVQKKTLRYLENIVHQTDQMNLLISQLMDFSRLQNSQFDLKYQKAVNLNEVVMRIVEQQRVAHPDYIILTQLGSETVMGSWDEARIEQVLNNLISNAVKYSPAGSPVLIAMEYQPDSEQVVISVKDQGQGIPPDEQGQVFDRFYRARSSKQKSVDGLGLGLYICHEIILKHGGKMWLDSQPNIGSTFYFSVPIKPS